MSEQKQKDLVAVDLALKVFEASTKIEAAKQRQAETQAYGDRLRDMSFKQLRREARRFAVREEGLNAAIGIVMLHVLQNTRVTKEEAFEQIKGKFIPRPNWVNELGKLSVYPR